MNNNGHIELYSEVVFIQDINDFSIKKGDKAFVIAEITSNQILVKRKTGYTNWVPKEALMLASTYENNKIDKAQEDVNIARVHLRAKMECLHRNLDKIKELAPSSSPDDDCIIYDYNKSLLEFNTAISYLEERKAYLSALEKK